MKKNTNDPDSKEPKQKKKKGEVDEPKSQSEENIVIPEKLKEYISEEIWNTWSPIRRESFTQIIKNPNTFIEIVLQVIRKNAGLLRVQKKSNF